MKKRLTADIQEDLHKRVKIMAVLKNINITVYLEQAILEALKRDEKVNE